METKEKTDVKYKTVSIERLINLPIDKVWKAWTEPESLKKWWGPCDYTCPHCTIDLKIGGKYLASMMGKDGKEIYSTGTYKEIIPRKKLVMTDSFSDSKGNITGPPEGMVGDWPKELIITVELEEKGDKTNMHLKQEPMPAKMYEDCIKGWQECFDKMDEI